MSYRYVMIIKIHDVIALIEKLRSPVKIILHSMLHCYLRGQSTSSFTMKNIFHLDESDIK